MNSPHARTTTPGILAAIFGVLLFSAPLSAAATTPEPAPPSATEATDATPQTAAPVSLEAAVASSSVAAGGLVIIEGTLLDEAGTSISGAGIRVMLDGSESPDSLVMTGDDGTFQTFAEVPSGYAEGDASLVVSFSGNDTHAAMQQEIALVVEQIPVAERTAPEPSSPATDVAGAFPSVETSAGTTDGTLSAESAEDDGPGASAWFYVALVVVGGAALLTTAGLVFRSRRGRGGEAVSRRAGSLDMLLEQAAEDEDIAAQADAPMQPEEDPRPRRTE
ncbi:MAG: hypothetical protein ACTHWA_06740 [Arachnia sp.]